MTSASVPVIYNYTTFCFVLVSQFLIAFSSAANFFRAGRTKNFNTECCMASVSALINYTTCFFLSTAHSFLSLFSLLQTFFRAGRTKYAHLHDTGPIDTAPALWEVNPETPSFSAHLSHMGLTSILERSSTPLHSFINNNSQQLEPSTLNKISMMEEELAALRKQIADLVMMQETKPQGWCHLTVILTHWGLERLMTMFWWWPSLRPVLI